LFISCGALRSSGLRPRILSSRQSRLHAIDDACAVVGQAFPLEARLFGIFLLEPACATSYPAICSAGASLAIPAQRCSAGASACCICASTQASLQLVSA
jgi:hypothetical protein